MSLTTGRGPLSGHPGGRFSAPLPDDLVYSEPLGRLVRGIRGGEALVTSEGAWLVHRAGSSPTYAFPAADVHPSLLAEPEPALDGYVQLPWDAVDAWFEEEEEVAGHPKNPYHRVDFLRTTRRLRVEAGGEVLVDTIDTMGVYETASPPRLYVRRDLVREELLVPSDTETYCPYKGTASYWSAKVGDAVVPDVAWSYEDPLPESMPIRGMLSFYEDRAEVRADLPAPDVPKINTEGRRT